MSAPLSEPRSSLLSTSGSERKAEILTGAQTRRARSLPPARILEVLMSALQRNSMKHRFTVIFEKEDEGGYHVFCPTLPGCHSQSETVEEGIVNIREAMQLYVEST